MRKIPNFFSIIQNFLSRPGLIMVVCLIMVFLSLVVEGSLLQLWRLHRQSSLLQNKISEVEKISAKIKMKISRASDLRYIDQQARDRFDLVGKDDLIFIFSDN